MGDNIDKSIKPRYMRSELKGKDLLHYFHFFAVSNRIDTSEQLHTPPPPPCHLSHKACALSLLPTIEDDHALQQNMAILISRILVNHFDSLNFSFSDVVQWHIPHQYTKEMSKKSDVVCYNNYYVLYYLSF